MSVYTLADLHLSFSVDKPMDIFGSRWQSHTEKLLEYWNYMVKNEDTVIVGGDISWAMNVQEALEDFKFINELNGNKIIMKGNHDYWWQSLKKLNEFIKENSFDTIRFMHNSAYEVEDIIVAGSRGWSCERGPSAEDKKIIDREAIRFDLSIKEAEKIRGDSGKEIVVFSHYPVIMPGEETSPILEVLVRHGIKRLYYGHLHQVNESRLIKRAGGIDLELVSADYRMFTPVRIN